MSGVTTCSLPPWWRLDQHETELVMRAYLSVYRVAQWSPTGTILGKHPSPVVSSTVRDAAGHLAASFRSRFERSPVHVEGSTQLLPAIRTLLRAFDNTDLPPERQKVITPKFLRKFFNFLSPPRPRDTDLALTHVPDLMLGAFFFAMRSWC
jgi:hypothetical protein